MTILQIKVAVATAELNSISAAAKMLHMSQPNASSSLKLLEEELGFQILYRASTGAVLTKKGEAFINYAQQILEANEKITGIRNADEIYRLRLGSVNYYVAAEPFFTLCSKYRDEIENDFVYRNVSISEGIQALIKRELDIIAAPILNYQAAGLTDECRKHNIVMTSICHVPAVIMVRNGHPALLDGRCEHITQGCDSMKEYPYVGLNNLSNDLSHTSYNDSDFIQCSHKMYADDTNMRLRMLESTNGFSFGIYTSDKIMQQYGLTFFPVPGVTLELFCLSRSNDAMRKENMEYIELLRTEMSHIINKRSM